MGRVAQSARLPFWKTKIGKLIGAPEGTVIVGDTLSIQVFQALSASIQLNENDGTNTDLLSEIIV